MNAIEIESPARLHLGFIDPSGSTGRRFGSLGLALDGLSTRLRLRRVASAREAYRVASASAQTELLRAEAQLARLTGKLGFNAPVSLELLEAIPPHAGLGSGTQLALAVGYGLARLAGLELPARDIAAMTERGARSGIGVGAFEQGGFVVDGGRGPRTQVPPLIARMNFPASWRITLIFDPTHVGLHGADEISAFRGLPPFPVEQATHLARLTLLTILPALAEIDFDQFGAALTEIQAAVGDHFAPAQGGRFASPHVAHWLRWFAERGATCYGQSSWGPTGFIISATAAEARRLLAEAKAARTPDDPVRFKSVAGRNVGARVNETDTAREPQPLHS
jgi:beta-RFAP synthase